MDAHARQNNFDLIRLVAAGQVVLWHGIEHLKVEVHPLLLWLLGSFPGVPIFFVVSGYLVSASYRRSRSVGTYFANRGLRIFPGLWLCFAFCFISIAWSYGLAGARWQDLVSWVLPNVVGLSHTPAFLKSFGTGSVNGSLWTIPVELQFYVVLPLLLLVLQRSGWRWGVGFVFCLAASFVYLWMVRESDSKAWSNVLLRLLPSWLYMFMLGMILEWRADWKERFVRDRFFVWAGAYLVWIVLLQAAGFTTVGNAATPLALIPLAAVVIAAAYSYRSLATRWLRGHDISYGMYLYHMPIVNLIVVLTPGLRGPAALVVCIVATLSLAGVSWWLVERPALRLKPTSKGLQTAY